MCFICVVWCVLFVFVHLWFALCVCLLSRVGLLFKCLDVDVLKLFNVLMCSFVDGSCSYRLVKLLFD